MGAALPAPTCQEDSRSAQAAPSPEHSDLFLTRCAGSAAPWREPPLPLLLRTLVCYTTVSTLTACASSISSAGFGWSRRSLVRVVVPVVRSLKFTCAGVADEPYEPIVLTIDPCPDDVESRLLSQRNDP